MSSQPSSSSSSSKRRFRLRPSRRLKLTREGRYFIAITLGVGLVGILTANNLLYLLLGMLLSLIIVSGILSEATLRSIHVQRKLPHRAQAERPHFVEISIENRKTRLPSYAIEIEDLRANQPADKRCFFLKIGPGASQVAAYRRIVQQRGVDEYIGFRVATRFPFGLFEKSRRLDLDGQLIIYPAVDAVRLPQAEIGNAAEGGESLNRGGGDEFFGLRNRRDGDDPRDIYWKRSTAVGFEVVVERSREVKQDRLFYLDDVLRDASQEEADRFEARIREIASRGVAHLRRGDRVRVEAKCGGKVSCSPATGADPLLRFLALIQLRPEESA